MTKDTGIERQIAREAARWYVCLQAPDVGDSQYQACAQWRDAHPEHERAWRLAEGFCDRTKLIPKDLANATFDRVRDSSRRRTVKALTMLLMAGPAAMLVQRSQTWQQLAADRQSGIGEQKNITLDDGTQIHLNTDSAIDIAYTTTQRRLKLVRGEILVKTGKDVLGRPFFLDSAQGVVRPIGTQFLVRQFAQFTQVAVQEGAVEVSTLDNPAHCVRLNAGQRLMFDQQRIESPSPLTSDLFDWSRGVLKADRMRVGDFALELSRYRSGLLRCDPQVADLRVSGAFQLFDTDQALNALTQVLPVQVLYRTRYWVTIVSRRS